MFPQNKVLIARQKAMGSLWAFKGYIGDSDTIDIVIYCHILNSPGIHVHKLGKSLVLSSTCSLFRVGDIIFSTSHFGTEIEL